MFFRLLGMLFVIAIWLFYGVALTMTAWNWWF